MVSNQKITQILYEISEYLEMKDDPFRPQAYQKAARAIEFYGQSLDKVYRKKGLKGLEKIPGVGKEIAKKIEEILQTGRLRYLEELRSASPVDVRTLTKIEGIGPKKIKALWQKLGITNLQELEIAAKQGKIRSLEGFGEKSEENILKGIEMLKTQKERIPLGQALPVAKAIQNTLGRVPGVKQIAIAGSIRRKKETVGDIDILVATDSPKNIMEAFVKLPQIEKVYGKGNTKASGRLKIGIDIDLRVVPESSFGAALQYFTGNKAHNIKLRRLAQKQGYKLNEYGLFKGNQQIAGETEAEVYQKLGVLMPPPEKRIGENELQLIQKQLIREKSVGAVIYYKTKGRKAENQTEYLILHYPKREGGSQHGHWDFVKGHIDKGETEQETLQREIKEETSLLANDYVVVKGFREIIHYYFKTKQGLHYKEVVFYLVKSNTKQIKLSFEHDGYKWLEYKKALQLLTFKGGKEILRKAHEFLKK